MHTQSTGGHRLAGPHPRTGAVAARTARLPAGRARPVVGRCRAPPRDDLVLRGNSRRWLRYLDRAAALALGVADGTTDGDAELALAVAHVVLEHDRMLIGLPGSAYHRTTERRQRLAEAIGVLEARIASTTDIDNHLEKS